MVKLSRVPILWQITTFIIITMITVLWSVNYVHTTYHTKKTTSIKATNHEIINTLTPLISPLLNNQEILKKQLKKIMYINTKIKYILIEKNNKYFLHVDTHEDVEESIKTNPTTITKQIQDTPYTLTINYYDKKESQNILSFQIKNLYRIYLIIVVCFIAIIVFIKLKLGILLKIRKSLEKKVPYSLKSEKEESIITSITKILEHNDKNEKQLKKLQIEFEDQLTLKTVSLIREIKERKEAEIKLESSINEKVVLLKEIHHRVKNNLAIITGLIRMQAREINDNDIKEVFISLQNRIKTMELIHTSLYRSENFTKIDFHSYLNSLVRSLKQSLDCDDNITFNIICEDIKLNIEQSIACGQIVNELIMNSLKYAFKAGEIGEICIELYEEDNLFTLMIGDSGNAENILLQKKIKDKSLGMTIVHELAKFQLKSRVEFINENGAKYKITFKKT